LTSKENEAIDELKILTKTKPVAPKLIISFNFEWITDIDKVNTVKFSRPKAAYQMQQEQEEQEAITVSDRNFRAT